MYASVAQWQSTSLVMMGLWVRFPPLAPTQRFPLLYRFRLCRKWYGSGNLFAFHRELLRLVRGGGDADKGLHLFSRKFRCGMEPKHFPWVIVDPFCCLPELFLGYFLEICPLRVAAGYAILFLTGSPFAGAVGVSVIHRCLLTAISPRAASGAR